MDRHCARWRHNFAVCGLRDCCTIGSGISGGVEDALFLLDFTNPFLLIHFDSNQFLDFQTLIDKSA